MYFLIWWTYDGIGDKAVVEETIVGIMNGVEDIGEIIVVIVSDPDWDMPGPRKVEVGLTGAKVIVSELDIVNDGGGSGPAVERLITVAVDDGGKDVALVGVDDLKLVKPREVTIGEEADDADVINVWVSLDEGKGVWGTQDENKEGGVEMDILVTVDRSCAEFEAEITSFVDETDEEVIIADGVAEVHRGINCVPSDDGTPIKKE
jgi:hypothetical protein